MESKALNLNYVQVKSETAYIDSRVYCRDIIEVHHGDWLQNVLYQHQALMEQHFGVLRFENGKLPERGKGSLGGRPEKYALLTEAQCNFALSLSNNSPKVVTKKAELVADFEKAKQQLKEQFQRQFQRQFLAKPDDYVLGLEKQVETLRSALRASEIEIIEAGNMAIAELASDRNFLIRIVKIVLDNFEYRRCSLFLASGAQRKIKVVQKR